MKIEYLVNSWKESYELQKKLLDEGYEWKDGIAINPKLPVVIEIGNYGTVIFSLHGNSKLLNYYEINTKEALLLFQKLSRIKKSKKLSI